MQIVYFVYILQKVRWNALFTFCKKYEEMVCLHFVMSVTKLFVYILQKVWWYSLFTFLQKVWWNCLFTFCKKYDEIVCLHFCKKYDEIVCLHYINANQLFVYIAKSVEHNCSKFEPT